MSVESPKAKFTSPTSPGREVDVDPQALEGTLPMDRTPLSSMPSQRLFSFAVQSTQLDESSRYMFSPGFGLTLEDLDMIKDHLVANGNFGESQQVSFKWLTNNITILPCLLPQSGNNLEHLIGKEYMYVKDALLALDELTRYGVISAEELAASDDARLLARSHHLDRLTYHSLANVVRNIIKDRPETNTILYMS